MSIYFYLIIWGFGGCLVGICIGFFFAAILSNKGMDYEAAFNQSQEQNRGLIAENTKLVSKLWEIETIINKYFGVK